MEYYGIISWLLGCVSYTVLTDCLYDHPHSVDGEEDPEIDVLAEKDLLQRVQWVHPGRD